MSDIVFFGGTKKHLEIFGLQESERDGKKQQKKVMYTNDGNKNATLHLTLLVYDHLVPVVWVNVLSHYHVSPTYKYW